MPVYRRVGRPGLIGVAARTAVVAGTATAVSGGMRARQQGKAQAAQAEAAQAAQVQAAQAQAAAAQAAAAQAAAVPPPAPDPVEEVDPLTQKLQQLAALHAQGILTDDEFTTAKARLLGL